MKEMCYEYILKGGTNLLRFDVEQKHGGAAFRCQACGEQVTSSFPALVLDFPEHIMRQLYMHARVKHGMTNEQKEERN
jgi:hypothetical protein